MERTRWGHGRAYKPPSSPDEKLGVPGPSPCSLPRGLALDEDVTSTWAVSHRDVLGHIPMVVPGRRCRRTQSSHICPAPHMTVTMGGGGTPPASDPVAQLSRSPWLSVLSPLECDAHSAAVWSEPVPRLRLPIPGVAGTSLSIVEAHRTLSHVGP